MRIVVSYENPIPASRADAEQFVNNAAALARFGHDVELVVPEDPSRKRAVRDEVMAFYEIDGPLRVREVHVAPSGHTAKQIDQARRVVWDRGTRDADFVYTRNFATLTAAVLAGVPVLFEHYRPWGDQYPIMQPYLRAVMASPAFLGMVVHSEFAADCYRRFGIPDELLCVCHNGFEPRRMQPVLSRDEARQKLGLPSDLPIAVYSGRMNEKKGLDVVLAMARQMPEVRFVLVGSTGRGPVEIEAEKLPNVVIAPWQTFSGVAPYLYAADVLLVPPSTSPLADHGTTVLPIKLFVYLAAGRPIFAGDSPDVRELLVHGENAILSPPGDVATAVTRMRSLVADRAAMERLGRACAARAASLTWDARAVRVTAFVERRLEAARRGDKRLAPFPWNRFGRQSIAWAREMIDHGGLRAATLPALDPSAGSAGRVGG